MASGMSPLLINAIGYLASAANVLVFFSKTMGPLRAAAIVSNGLFVSYFTLRGIYPMAALNAMMLPINVIRLQQIARLMHDIRKSCANVLSQDFDYSALEEKSRVLRLPAGVVLYRKDDPAYDAYVLLSGEIVFVEQNIRVRPVSLFGEMGMFTEDSRRTMTAVTVTEAALLQTGYDDFLDLASHDPRFSFYLMHLMVKRMMRNIEAYRAPP